MATYSTSSTVSFVPGGTFRSLDTQPFFQGSEFGGFARLVRGITGRVDLEAL
jgi:hypothetical protein